MLGLLIMASTIDPHEVSEEARRDQNVSVNVTRRRRIVITNLSIKIRFIKEGITTSPGGAKTWHVCNGKAQRNDSVSFPVSQERLDDWQR